MKLVNFRIGVLLVHDRDLTEEVALKNSEITPQFQRFLEFLGKRVELFGWDKYAGGLDTRNDLTGSHSVHRQRENGEQIMFHIAPWIPMDSEGVSRKRFTGNDLINILFLNEGHGGFKISSIRSQQTHCLVTVRPRGDSILCDIFVKEAFKGTVNGPFRFELNSVLDQQRFSKLLVDLEHMCYESEPFRSKLIRTRAAMLSQLSQSL